MVTIKFSFTKKNENKHKQKKKKVFAMCPVTCLNFPPGSLVKSTFSFLSTSNTKINPDGRRQN